jgi:hypothetical protein
MSFEDRANGLSGVMRELLGEIGERLRFIDERLRQYDLTIQQLFRQDERCQRVAAVEGVGPSTMTSFSRTRNWKTCTWNGSPRRSYSATAHQ